MEIIEESILIPEASQCIDMTLHTVIAYGTNEIIWFSIHIADNDATTGADVVFSGHAARTVLHVVLGAAAAEDLVYALVVRLPVIGMDMVLPKVAGTVHILGGQAVGVHRVFGPAGEVMSQR